MKYQQPTFTLPTVNKAMSQTEYEISVGLRCPVCEALFKPGKPHIHRREEIQ